MAAEATRGSMLLRFGRLAVHPVVSHVNGFVKRDLGRLVILGILDVAAFDELLSGVRALDSADSSLRPVRVRESSLLSLSTSLSASRSTVAVPFWIHPTISCRRYRSKKCCSKRLRSIARMGYWTIVQLPRHPNRPSDPATRFRRFSLGCFSNWRSGNRWRCPTFWLRD